MKSKPPKTKFMDAVLKPLEMAKLIVARALQEGDSAVDATLGNGHDAFFLAECVGEKGSVIGFDIQQQAIESSRERLSSSVCKTIKLYQTGHENMAEYIEGEISAVMFNLGYLPSADKSVISQKKTTLQAIQVACDVLKKKGVVSIMCYPGHEGGEEESQAVRDYTSQLVRSSWRVVEYKFHNAPNNPAFLILLEKLV